MFMSLLPKHSFTSRPAESTPQGVVFGNMNIKETLSLISRAWPRILNFIIIIFAALMLAIIIPS